MEEAKCAPPPGLNSSYLEPQPDLLLSSSHLDTQKYTCVLGTSCSGPFPNIGLGTQPLSSHSNPHPLRKLPRVGSSPELLKTMPTGYFSPASFLWESPGVALLRLNLVLLVQLDLTYCIGGETHYEGFQNTCRCEALVTGLWQLEL